MNNFKAPSWQPIKDIPNEPRLFVVRFKNDLFSVHRGDDYHCCVPPVYKADAVEFLDCLPPKIPK